jgi:pyridoxamine 5'-phosphate oxidase
MKPELNHKIKTIQHHYVKGELLEEMVEKDPIKQFGIWLHEAFDEGDVIANTMALSTVNEFNMPSSRIVLLKDATDRGFTFFTNYNSTKSKNLSNNSNASLLFFWKSLERQVCVQGKIVKIEETESIEYFNTRPRESQIAAWASNQSEKITGRKDLELNYTKFEKKFERLKEIPKPELWGGFMLIPTTIEFWQGREHRLNDRIIYTFADAKWEITRLAP